MAKLQFLRRSLIPFAVFSFALAGCNENGDSPLMLPDGVALHTEQQRAFLNDAVENVHRYAEGVLELSYPLKPTFSWKGENKAYTVYLSEKEDYSDPILYSSGEAKVSFTNLKVDTTYFYKAVAEGKTVVENTFHTSAEIIRNMYVDGVTNVRDLGGYPVKNGILKQGLIYRGGRLNRNKSDTVKVTIKEGGMSTMLNEMKLRSEIDLRLLSNNEVGALEEGVGVLGESVRYYQCPMNYDIGLEHEFNTIGLQKVFSILGDKNNYPTYFHCSIGTDRTGYVAWLINACLGVSEEYLWRDYLFSNFGNIGGSRAKSDIEEKYVKSIHDTEGATLQEKAVNYLKNKGIKQEQIDVLREMMLPQE